MQFLSTPVWGSVARVCFGRFLGEKSLSVKVPINKEDFGIVDEFLMK